MQKTRTHQGNTESRVENSVMYQVLGYRYIKDKTNHTSARQTDDEQQQRYNTKDIIIALDFSLAGNDLRLSVRALEDLQLLKLVQICRARPGLPGSWEALL